MLFYFNDNIREFESNKRYLDIISFLENKDDLEQSLKITTILAYAWYFYEDVEISKSMRDEDLKYCYDKLLYCINIGLEQYNNVSELLLVMGYILDINWMLIFDNEKYENLGKKMLEKSFSISTNINVCNLSKYFLSNDLTERGKLLKLININELFPSNSLIDQYFKEVIR